MAGIIAKFKITKDGDSGVLVFTVVAHKRSWHMESSVKWFPSTGSWATIRNATKFRQWSMVRLVDDSDNYVAEFPSPPYTVGAKLKAELMDHTWFIQYDTGQKFDVEVLQGPVGTKTFQIRENTDVSLSYGVGQVEWAIFEIQDPKTTVSAKYDYKGFGFGISPPVPKLPKVLGGASSTGPWNDFDAPGFLEPDDFEGSATIQTPVNVGMGSSVSYNVLDVHASPDGFAIDVQIKNFSTGNTFSLPSSGATSGRLSLSKPVKKIPLGGYGKFGNAGR